MANKELAALPAVGTLAGTQVLYLVDENNNSRKVALSDLAQWIKTAASIVPASNPWKGARVKRTTNLSLASGIATTLAWQAAELDTTAFWSAGAPTRLTVPAGVTKVRITANARFDAASAGARQILIFKNGATFNGRGAIQMAGQTNAELNIVSAVVPVVAGDFFECQAFQGSGSALNLMAHESTWLQIEVVEG